MERHEVRTPHRRLVERLDRQIIARDLRSRAAQPCRGRGEPEGLAAEIVGGDEDHARRGQSCKPAIALPQSGVYGHA
jgi:hypothetical protein